MKHPERVEDYLEHITQAVERATEYIERLDFGAFQKSHREQDAVMRNIEIIGEAANRIQKQSPGAPGSRPVFGRQPEQRKIRAGPPNIFISRSLAVHSDSIRETAADRVGHKNPPELSGRAKRGICFFSTSQKQIPRPPRRARDDNSNSQVSAQEQVRT